MTQLLVTGEVIRARDFPNSPIIDDGDNIRTYTPEGGADAIYPKHVIEGYKLVDADVPDGFTCAGYTWDGTAVQAKPPVVVPPTVPDVVSPRQIRQAMSRVPFGGGFLRTAVEAAIAAADQDAKDWYAYATEFQRSNPHVLTMAAVLSVTNDQLDQLWILAGSL